MKATLTSLTFLLALAVPAASAEFSPCADVGALLESVVSPVVQNSVTLYDGKVTLYNIDTIEPACCSSGLAVVLPAKDDELGGNACKAIVGYVSIDATRAKRSYDPQRGMLLEIPAARQGDNGERLPESLIRVRINLKAGSVTLER